MNFSDLAGRLRMTKYVVIIHVFMIVTWGSVSSVTFDGKIAGNRPIEECVNGFASLMMDFNPKMFMTTSQLARETGYPAEEHLVKTDDGFILTIHRIPGKPGAPPVFLQHGFLASSYDWLVTGKENALAFKLADAGYDVWLGNVRGNTYSRCHTKHQPSEVEFWEFSWHEIGIYDLPAMITFVTKTTDQQLIYIGHSMGTTAFFVMGSERLDVASKVKAMFALAPVAYMDHGTTPLRMLAPFARQLEYLVRPINAVQLLSQSLFMKMMVQMVCSLSAMERSFCTNMIFSPMGTNTEHLNEDLVPDILYHIPAGCSLKIGIHYLQVYSSKRFQHYDYGTEKNVKLYNNTKPPSYDLSKIAVPTGIFWSDSDIFSNAADVLRLYEELPNKIISYEVEFPSFYHNDYQFSTNAPKYVYEKLLSVIENYK